jgi:hypothetical protein
MSNSITTPRCGSLPQGKRFSILHEALATLRAAGIRPDVRSGKGSHFKLVSPHLVGQ